MRIYNVTIAIIAFDKPDPVEKENKELFVLGDHDDPREFATMVYTPLGYDILRFNAEEVDQKNLRVSKNALAPYKQRYFNEN